MKVPPMTPEMPIEELPTVTVEGGKRQLTLYADFDDLPITDFSDGEHRPATESDLSALLAEQRKAACDECHHDTPASIPQCGCPCHSPRIAKKPRRRARGAKRP
jgi:hypothetical protein